MNNPMKYVLFVSVAALIIYSLYSPIKLNSHDHMEIVEDNNSIEDYEAKRFCEMKIGDIRNKKIISLLKKTHRANIELADGSTYLDIYIYEGNDGPIKYHQAIDYGTKHQDAAKLIEFLVEECKPQGM
jgi:hypothetical protein